MNVANSTPALRFRAKNQWIDGSHNHTTIKEFYGGRQEDTSRTVPFVFDNDEPPILLEDNKGANPVEFILHGLAGCLASSMILHAAAREIPVEKVESALEGELDVQGLRGLDDSARNGYEGIRVTFRLALSVYYSQKVEIN
ncbi:MAG: OsmC family protein [Phaeodactylibacter sp.]|nr:OsmC family protein [Phaeodactylibacter sp.]MCB9302989.1 OsmC family protein [Lewinellaceae bacterium]